MLTIERENGVMILDASGKISASDIEAFEPVFEQFAEMQGKVPMVIDATKWRERLRWRGIARGRTSDGVERKREKARGCPATRGAK